MKKTIGIDLDTTLNQFDISLLNKYNSDYDDSLTPEDLVSWETHTLVKEECGKQIWDYLLEPGFFLDLGVQPNSQSVTRWLAEHYDLYIVTAYKAENCLEKREWIKNHFPHIPADRIMFVNNKGLVATDYLIDDGPHNISAFRNKGVLVDAAYNKELEGNYTRVYDWIEIRDYFISELENS